MLPLTCSVRTLMILVLRRTTDVLCGTSATDVLCGTSATDVLCGTSASLWLRKQKQNIRLEVSEIGASDTFESANNAKKNCTNKKLCTPGARNMQMRGILRALDVRAFGGSITAESHCAHARPFLPCRAT